MIWFFMQMYIQVCFVSIEKLCRIAEKIAIEIEWSLSEKINLYIQVTGATLRDIELSGSGSIDDS